MLALVALAALVLLGIVLALSGWGPLYRWIGISVLALSAGIAIFTLGYISVLVYGGMAAILYGLPLVIWEKRLLVKGLGLALAALGIASAVYLLAFFRTE